MSMPVIDPIQGIAAQLLKRYANQLPKEHRWASPGELACQLNPSTVQTPALKRIDEELVLLATDPGVDKLIISMPPQEGKSERASHYFPLWLLERNPELRIAIISYTDEMARRHGSAVKQDVETYSGDEGTLDLGIKLRADSKAAGRWHIQGHQGGIYCTGIGGSLTGKPVDILIIDDPIKNMEQAQSEKNRQRAIDFWQAVVIPRLEHPGAKCVIIQTRWHEDDLAGFVLKNEPGQWRVLNIPAQAEDENDPLGRCPGEFMVSARGNRNWQRIKQNAGSYVWSALYQGAPAPAAGGLFKRSDMRYWVSLQRDTSRHGLMRGQRVDLGGRTVYLDDCWRFLAIDLAASVKTSADWTVAGAFAISPDGDLILLGSIRARIEEKNHWKIIKPLYDLMKADVVYVESRMFGTTLVKDASRAGVQVQELKADSDKITRAIPASVRMENGMIWLPTVDTMSDVGVWVNELISFPNASHDDCVDVIAYAARVVAAYWLGEVDAKSRTVGNKFESSTDTEINQVFQSATGQTPNGIDFENVRW